MFFEKSHNSVTKKPFIYSKSSISIDEPDKLLEQIKFGEQSSDGQTFKMTFKSYIDLEFLRLKFQGPRRNYCTLYDVIIEIQRKDDSCQTPVFMSMFKGIQACENESLIIEIDEPIYIIPNMWYTVKFELMGMTTLAFNKTSSLSSGDTETSSDEEKSSTSSTSSELPVTFINTKNSFLEIIFRLPSHSLVKSTSTSRKKKNNSLLDIFCFK